MGDAMEVEHEDGGIMEVDLQDGTESLGYENHQPYRRRGSMSEEEERQRRASIKAILADTSITPTERRRSIQLLMDGRRSSIGATSVASTDSSNSYGYGDAEPQVFNSNENDSDIEEDDDEDIDPVSNENTKRAEQTRPHCAHYNRNCSLIAPCCGAVFGCRICHDDSPVLPPTLICKKVIPQRYARSSSMPGSFTSMDTQIPEDTHHNIDRFAVKEVICRVCYTKQSSKT
jgi:hypothetical protein